MNRFMKNQSSGWGGIVGVWSIIAFVVSLFAAWGTHVVVSILALTGDASVQLGYGFLLLAGIVFPPLGVIHGYGVWFGIW